MTLINPNDPVLIGQGSEWFWEAVSGIAVAVTLVGLYLQLRMQRSAAAVTHLEALEREYSAEGMTRSRLAVLLALRDGAQPPNLPPEAARILDFWERIGYLVRAGHIDRRLVNKYWANVIRLSWGYLAPYARFMEEQFGGGMQENFEWLAGLMAKMDRKAGRTQIYDEAYLAQLLPVSIAIAAAEVRVAEELRAVIVRPMSTVTLTREPVPDREPAPDEALDPGRG